MSTPQGNSNITVSDSLISRSSSSLSSASTTALATPPSIRKSGVSRNLNFAEADDKVFTPKNRPKRCSDPERKQSNRTIYHASYHGGNRHEIVGTIWQPSFQEILQKKTRRRSRRQERDSRKIWNGHGYVQERDSAYPSAIVDPRQRKRKRVRPRVARYKWKRRTVKPQPPDLTATILRTWCSTIVREEVSPPARRQAGSLCTVFRDIARVLTSAMHYRNVVQWECLRWYQIHDLTHVTHRCMRWRIRQNVGDHTLPQELTGHVGH